MGVSRAAREHATATGHVVALWTLDGENTKQRGLIGRMCSRCGTPQEHVGGLCESCTFDGFTA